MRNSHRPPLDSPPDDLVEAVVRVCENPGTFWSDANAQVRDLDEVIAVARSICRVRCRPVRALACSAHSTGRSTRGAASC